MSAKHKHIVVIDDSSTDRYIFEKVSNICGFAQSITFFGTATEGLGYLSAMDINHPDWPELIFVDIWMPLMNGFAFLDAYEKLEGVVSRKSVVVLSSTHHQPDLDRIKLYRTVLTFIEKPIGIEKLKSLSIKN